MSVDARHVLSHLVPLLGPLAADLAAQAADPAAEATLRAEHAAELEARRTADPYAVWLGWRVQQLAAAWLLTGLFLRALEDRGLLPPRLRELDARRATLRRLCPWLDDRALLRLTVAEAAHTRGFAAVFDEAHSPIWTLWPSAAGATALLEGLRAPTGLGALDLSGDTRWLGDVYEQLDEGVRARYALLQTPDFVEALLLELALEPALRAATRAQDVKVIDPTCGSGHLLVASFRRIFAELQREQPRAAALDLALLALDCVHGVDLNPYAAAIAHFRLVLAVVDAAGIQRAEELPEGLDPKIGAGDGLRPTEGMVSEQQALFAASKGERAAVSRPGWVQASRAAQRAMARGQTYGVVVGNPPYITVKDPVLNGLYRETYPESATGLYQLVSPFVHRFFQLAGDQGRVAMIVGNGFMKRNFGASLIEKVLPKVNLTHVIDTSGAFIPGHGTPTVILAGSGGAPEQLTVRAVLGKRGEPSTPEEPAKGLVWRSIVEHLDDVGFDNDFVTVASLERAALSKHPWALKGGGAGELQERVEDAADHRLGAVCASIGFMCITKQDDVFNVRQAALLRHGVEPSFIRPFGIGEDVRDWSVAASDDCVYPYDSAVKTVPLAAMPGAARFLWRWRRVLGERRVFGGQTYFEAGKPWWEYGQIPADRQATPLSIAFAFVATHNHFALDRGGKVFKQTAPIIKLPPEATEAEHLALVGYLNSSVACFWMKQVFFDKGNRGEGGGTTSEAWERFYEHDGTKLKTCPILHVEHLQPFAEAADALGRAWQQSLITAERIAATPIDGIGALRDLVASMESEKARLEEQLRWLQEEMDWLVYAAVGLADPNLTTPSLPSPIPRLAPAHRPADRLFAARVVQGEVGRRYFELCRLPAPELVQDLALDALAQRRLQAIEASPSLQHIETPEFKRTFRESFRVTNLPAALTTFLLDALEAALQHETAALSPRDLARALRDDPKVCAVAALLAGQPEPDLAALFAALLDEEAVALTAAQRYTDAGLIKHAAWRQTWAAQDAEDRGEQVKVPLPPKYGSGDFRKPATWRLRGKLDVPKERFVRLPVDPDGLPLLLWAGHAAPERMAALAQRFDETDDHDERVALLVAMTELLPELLRWWGDDRRYGAPLRDIWPPDLEVRRRALAVDAEDLSAWRPARAARASAPSAAPRAQKAPKAAKHSPEDLLQHAALSEPTTRGELAARLGWPEAEVGRLAEALVEQGRWAVLKKRPLTYGVVG